MKRIVICCDGTWNTPDQMDQGCRCPSNVVKVARGLAPIDGRGLVQVVYYHPGVGTGRGFDRLFGGAFGDGLEGNIEAAYRFIVDNYREADEIFLFGFSRGAFTVRSLAGFIRKCGLLEKVHAEMFPEAFALYRRHDPTADEPDVVDFRQRYSRAIRITFIGVWDTVGALGIPGGLWRYFARRRYEFHDVSLSRQVRYAYQALAIDERRTSFRPTLWQTAGEPTQTVEQVWFPGVHTNVGGGYRDAGLSDCAFEWMKEKAVAAGLAFDETYLHASTRPNPLGELRNSMTLGYRLLGEYLRPIGDGQAQSVDASALERRARDEPPYRPRNLERYLARHRTPPEATPVPAAPSTSGVP